MGKKKENMGAETPSPHKKYKAKKLSKKIKKTKLEATNEDDDDDIDIDDTLDYGSDSYSPAQISAADKLKSQNNKTPTSGGKMSKKKKQGKGVKADSETSSEEERWLDAIESGKLEEVDDELKKIKPKDPKLMTARQRAMYEKSINEKDMTSAGPSGVCQNNMNSILNTSIFMEGVQANVSCSGELLLALPTYKEKEKILTEEAIQKAQLKSQKRKQLADEKREKDKKKTMERLLKKHDSKTVKSAKIRPAKQQLPVISYRNSADGATISFPPNIEFPLAAQKSIEPPKPIICGISGCLNLKRYNCSKTSIPLCSLECYKKNVASIKQIIC